MSRVSKDSIKKLNEFIDSLPAEARNKCALCNETLVHLVKTAEVETGAGTATVTRHLADRINEDAAAGDRVSGEALRSRIVTAEHGRRPSEKEKSAQCINKPQPEPPGEKEDEGQAENESEDSKQLQDVYSDEELGLIKEELANPLTYLDYDISSPAMRYARMAVLDLEKIENSHPDKDKAFDYVIEWINKAKGV